MQFKDELRRLREVAQLTQESLAQKAGTSIGNVRNYEQGLRLPSFPIVVKLASALGVTCTAFAGCEDVQGEASEEPEPKKPAPKGKPKK
ncbi:MAG: helix-turn-helix domain-containing protein [Planctomycetes bacterium]|nr:helix-turn-helix domain-containing protein [Planctomycetota bacterium]